MAESDMRGAQNEPVRDNPPVRSKFDKSHGHGLKAPHMAAKGPVVSTTTSAPTVRSEPKQVGTKGSIRSEHIDPSQLGTGMAEGRHYAKSPNMAQTQMQGKSSTLTLTGMPGTQDSRSANGVTGSPKETRLGTQMPYRSTKVSSDNRVTKVSSRQGPGVLAGRQK